jgi:hypothetical protein
VTTISFDEYPYPHAGECLGFEIESCELDDGTTVKSAGQKEFHIFDCDDELSWNTVCVEAKITVERDTLEEVFPDPDDHDGVLIISGRCRATHQWFVNPIKHDNFGGGTFTAELELERDEFREDVEISPQLIRNKRGNSETDYAKQPGRELATGPSAYFYFDEPQIGVDTDLPVDAAKFSNRPELGDESAEWYVDTRNPERPKLWFNEDHPHVVSIMDAVEDQTKHGYVGRVVLNHVAVPMLTQFTIKAAKHAVMKDGIEYPWQEALLTEVCGEYFGDDPDPEELEAMLGVEAIDTTLNRVDQIIQRRRTPQEDVERLLGVIGDG